MRLRHIGLLAKRDIGISHGLALLRLDRLTNDLVCRGQRLLPRRTARKHFDEHVVVEEVIARHGEKHPTHGHQ